MTNTIKNFHDWRRVLQKTVEHMLYIYKAFESISDSILSKKKSSWLISSSCSMSIEGFLLQRFAQNLELTFVFTVMENCCLIIWLPGLHQRGRVHRDQTKYYSDPYGQNHGKMTGKMAPILQQEL